MYYSNHEGVLTSPSAVGLFKDFIVEVTERSVVAVLSQEEGVSSVETMVHRLRSWSVEALSTHYKTRLMCRGWVVFEEGGLAVHHEDIANLQHMSSAGSRWGLVEI